MGCADPPLHPQGNDITLVAYQPELPPRTPRAFEIVFREVGALGSVAPHPPGGAGRRCPLTSSPAHSTTGSGRTGGRPRGST